MLIRVHSWLKSFIIYMNKKEEEKTELRHEPEPKYRTIFYIVFLVAVLYLVVIMMAA